MKRTISFIVIFCMLASNMVSLSAYATEHTSQREDGYIIVRADGVSAAYHAIVEDDTVFLSAEDISQICGWKYEYYVNAPTMSRFFRPRVEDLYGVDLLEIDYDSDTKVASAAGKEYAVSLIVYNGKDFFPLPNMLYLLHAQWCVEDGTVIVNNLPDTIIEFTQRYYYQIVENQASELDLLINGESKLSHAFKSALAGVFNNFSMWVVVPYWPGEGWFPAITTELCEDALLQIAVNDNDFLDEKGELQIEAMMEESLFKFAGNGIDTVKTLIETPEKIDGIFEWLEAYSEAHDSFRFNPYYYQNIATPEIKAKAKELLQFSRKKNTGQEG